LSCSNIDCLLLYSVDEGDVNKVGDKVLLARGGDGGMSSNQFAGQKGDALSVTLDLKVISDIGFVGYVVVNSKFKILNRQRFKVLTTMLMMAVVLLCESKLL